MFAGSSLSRFILGAALAVWPGSAAAAPEPEEDGPVTVVFVGGSAGDDGSPTLGRLKARLEALEARRGVVVFTGDYGEGELPAEGASGREREEGHLLAHVAAARDFAARGGRVYFLAGPREFGGGGTRAVRRLRAFLNRSFRPDAGAPGDDAEEEAPGLDVMPQAGCGDVTVLELTRGLGLLLLESQWWMQDWASDPDANQGCEVKTRAAFGDRLRVALSDYRTRRLIVATHHPLRSDGEFGGSFTAGAHLRPAPLLGTLLVLARQAGLVEQYQNYPLVRAYVELLLDEAQRQGAYVFASGHDANLQYLHVEKQVQLVSGTSARNPAPTVEASPGDFAAATPGWAEVSVEPSGAGEVTYRSGETAQVLFRAALPDVPAPAPAPDGGPPPFPEGQVTSTFTRTEVWQLGGVLKALLGSFYADAYALQLPWDTLNLETELGGLRVTGLGGGSQTNSLKLRDARGADWVVRAVTKDASRVLTWPQNQATVLNRLLDHGYTASQPEAALAVPRLSRALGLLHAEPRLLYLPDQQALAGYRGFIANELVLMEQRPKAPKVGAAPESLLGPTTPGSKTHVRTTQQVLDRLIARPGKHHLDQEEMLRARLLDNLVGDWDRHPGQWRFAGVPGPDGTRRYRPIARDRDQVFANYDGLGFLLARLGTPAARRLQPFTSDFGDVGWLNYNARNLDPVVLNRIPRQRWLTIAAEVQAALTDAVLDEALATWHPQTYALDGARIAAALKTRRDALVTWADTYFAHTDRRVDVLGSSGDDEFELWLEDRGRVRVAVRGREHHGEAAAPFFERTFEPEETAELRLYGLAGDDTLTVHGPGPTPITIHFVGGPGQDRVTAGSDQQGAPLDAPTIHLHDAPQGATIDATISVADERTSEPRFNEYDPEENHEPDWTTFLPSLAVSPDTGLWVGARLFSTVQGFKHQPFAARHEVGAAFATATLGVALDYHGLFPHSVGVLDQQVELVVTPTTTRNFFGLTNAYLPDPARPNFYRVRQGWYEARYGLLHHFGGTWARAGVQALAQAVVTQATPGRFVSDAPDAASGLGARYFAGLRLFVEASTFDDAVLPTRGVSLLAAVEGRVDLARAQEASVTWKATAAFAFPFDRQRRVVLITRLGAEGIVGGHPFYFAPALGDTNLRAYHLQQLAGDVAFAQSTDLRIDVVRIGAWLPGTVGVNLSVDHGRVWGTTLVSNDYHLDYGGGVWWSILEAFGLSLEYYRGLAGGSRFVFSLGPLFSRTGF